MDMRHLFHNIIKDTSEITYRAFHSKPGFECYTLYFPNGNLYTTYYPSTLMSLNEIENYYYENYPELFI